MNPAYALAAALGIWWLLWDDDDGAGLYGGGDDDGNDNGTTTATFVGVPTSPGAGLQTANVVIRPPGDPPNPAAPASYDATRFAERIDILDAFSSLGYATPASRDTMNDLGADGALGGGDDVPSPVVRQFQLDYNAVSVAGTLGGNAGGLTPDGYVGPKTLNGLAHALDSLPVLGLGPWQQVVTNVRGG